MSRPPRRVRALAVALGALACDTTNVATGPPAPEDPPQEESADPVRQFEAEEGEWEVELSPLTRARTGPPPRGDAELELEDGRLKVEVDVRGGAPERPHRQFVYDGSRCPAAEGGPNAAVVRERDVAAAAGKILLALNEPVKQASGAFPVANQKGEVRYRTSASLSSVGDDLTDGRVPDGARYRDLRPGEPLTLDDRALVIYGAVVDGAFDPDVAIACGVLRPD